MITSDFDPRPLSDISLISYPLSNPPSPLHPPTTPRPMSFVTPSPYELILRSSPALNSCTPSPHLLITCTFTLSRPSLPTYNSSPFRLNSRHLCSPPSPLSRTTILTLQASLSNLPLPSPFPTYFLRTNTFYPRSNASPPPLIFSSPHHLIPLHSVSSRIPAEQPICQAHSSTSQLLDLHPPVTTKHHARIKSLKCC